MDVSSTSWAALAAASFAAGFVDAIAGGGGLITVPALLAAGLPPAEALATNKMVSVAGSATSAWRFERSGLVGRSALLLAALSFAASIGGAAAMVRVPGTVLRIVVIAMLLFALGAVLTRSWKGGERQTAPARWGTAVWLAAGAIGFYDGFFGPGTGTFLAAVFVAAADLSLPLAAGHARLLNFGSNLGSVALFAAQGAGRPLLALTLLPCMIGGAWLGTSLAIRRGAPLIRAFLAVVVLALCAKLVWDLAR